MKREYFLKTARIGFSNWKKTDMHLAEVLWGDPNVTKYICARGQFEQHEISERLDKEIQNEQVFQVQYWPIFTLTSGELIGCCGLRPRSSNTYEIGFHLRPKFWGRGYATEAAQAVVQYAFSVLKAEWLFAGHNPQNAASSKVLYKLGFQYVGDEFYAPTGLYHPSYQLKTESDGIGADDWTNPRKDGYL